MSKSFISILLLLAVMSLGSAKFPEHTGESPGIQFFQGTWQEVLDESEETGKPIFVDAYAVWCGPCRWMASNVFTDNQVADYYNEHFISYKFDMEKGEGPAFAAKYGVRAYPTLFYLDGAGTVIKKVMGAQNPSQFLLLGQGVVASNNASSN